MLKVIGKFYVCAIMKFHNAPCPPYAECKGCYFNGIPIYSKYKDP